MPLYSALTDLLRQVANTLLPEHGGTGSTYGEERVVVKAINSTGSNLPLYSLVKPTFGANDIRVELVDEAGSTQVLGSVVGYYGGEGVLIEAAAPDGYEVAVQTAGVARFLISSNVTRAEYAFSTTSAGKITSSTAGSGAFGLVLDTAWLTQTSNARVFMSAQSSASASGGWDAIITKGTDESVTSSATLQDDDELFFAAVSNGFYQFEAHIIEASPVGSTAPDFKFAFGEDTNFRGYLAVLGGNATTSTAEVTAGSVDQSNAKTVQTLTTPVGIIVWGSWISGGGTFRLKWAQGGSNINAVTVYAGSTLKIKRLA